MIRSMARSWLTLEQWVHHSEKESYTKEEIISLMKEIFQIEVDNILFMDMDKARGGSTWMDEVMKASRANVGEEKE